MPLMNDTIVAMYGENKYALNILNAMIDSGRIPKAVLIERSIDTNPFIREFRLLFSSLKKKGIEGFLKRLSGIFVNFLKFTGIEERENTPEAFAAAKPFLKYYDNSLKLSDFDFKKPGIELKEMKTNSDEFISYIKKNKIKVVLVGTKIISRKVLESTGCLYINGHPGYLPYMRGMDSVKWSLYNSHRPGGTLHFIDAGVDTGKIIQKGLVPVSENDSFASLRMKCRDLCISFFLENIDKIRAGKVSPKNLQEQDVSQGFQSTAMGFFKLQKAKQKLNELKIKQSFKQYPDGAM